MYINTNAMDQEADIKWIQKELKQVKDPTLIEAFKNLLQYRKKVTDGDVRDTIEEYNKDLDEAIKEIENGEYHTQEGKGANSAINAKNA